MRDSTSLSTAVATAIVLAILVAVLYPVVAEAGERAWIVDQDGETIGYVEPGPYNSDKLIVRDRAGRRLGVIEEGALGNGHVILDRHGDRLGVIEGRQDRRGERPERRDWRDGPAVEWGSYEDRWGR